MTGRLKTIVRVVGIVLMLAAAYYFASRLIDGLPVLESIDWGIRAWLGLLASILLYLGVLLTGATAWHVLLRGVGEQTAFYRALTVFGMAQFAKYIPGNFAQHIGRLALGKDKGMSLTAVAFSMTIEVAWVVVASAIVAIFGLLLGGHALATSIPGIPPKWEIALAGAAAIIAPLAGVWAIMRWRSARTSATPGGVGGRFPRPIELVSSLALEVLGFLLLGAILELIARAVFNAAGSHVMASVGVFAVAWIAGFLTPGAPAGLGVRDAIILAGLTPLYGTASAAAIALVLRLVTTAGDGLGFLFAWAADRRMPSPMET